MGARRVVLETDGLLKKLRLIKNSQIVNEAVES